MSTSTTNFALVDAAFGPHADLYTDVLGMDDAHEERTREGIAQAYAVRRATLLAQLEQEDSTASSREAVQGQLDAVVWTVRYLNHSKAEYDASPRCRRRRITPLPASSSSPKGYFRRSKKTTPSSSMDDEDENVHPQSSKPRSSSKKKTKKNNNKKEHLQAHDSPSRVHWGNNHDSTFAVHTATEMPSVSYYTADATTVHTGGDETMDSTLILKDMDDDNDGNLLSSCCADQSRMLRKVQREIAGACDDALTSFDQVFHAFTLTDQDISAVTKKIDRAKKQALAAED